MIKVVCVVCARRRRLKTIVRKVDERIAGAGQEGQSARTEGRKADGQEGWPDISGKLLLVIISHWWNETINLSRPPSHHKSDLSPSQVPIKLIPVPIIYNNCKCFQFVQSHLCRLN